MKEMKHLKSFKLFEAFDEKTRKFDKNSLNEMASELYDIIKSDDRVVDSFVWGSFFEKENPKDIDIVIKLNCAIGQFDDKIEEIANLQKSYVTIKNKDGYQYPLDITIVDDRGEAFTLFAMNNTSNTTKSPVATDSYNNLDENRPIKKLEDMFH